MILTDHSVLNLREHKIELKTKQKVEGVFSNGGHGVVIFNDTPEIYFIDRLRVWSPVR